MKQIACGMFACALALAGLLPGSRSQAALITNGDLFTSVGRYANGNGNTDYRLVTPDVTVNGTTTDSGVDENQWLNANIAGGFEFSAAGGNGGGGFVNNVTYHVNPRAVLQFVRDDKATTGIINIGMDVLFHNTNANPLFYNIELYAWNTGDAVPLLSVGGPTANVATYHVTTLNDAVTLIDNVVLDYSSFTDSTWTTASVATVDLGTGYDFYAWRISVVGAESSDTYAFDNVTVIAAEVDDDGDGMSNEYEDANDLDKDSAADRNEDLDSDGLTNFEEFTAGTWANDPDSDHDGLNDYLEINLYSTNPLDADSDDDFLNDSDEILVYRTLPMASDSDSDTHDDGAELAALSNPREATDIPSDQDSDGDGLLDRLENNLFGNLDSEGVDDNDSDGVLNIVEQAFGSDMSEFSSRPDVQLAGSLELNFLRHRVAGVGYELRVSEDLEHWNPYIGALSETTNVSVDADYEKVTYQLFGAVPKQFVKVNSRTEITSRPNIVLIYTDDQGYGDVSALNPASKFQTPNMDQLIAQGIAFTDGHCSDTVCTPSRYGLLTGRYSWRTVKKAGVLGADVAALIPDTRTTLASLLKSEGYHTAMIGKWHLGMDIPGTKGNRDFSNPQPIADMPLDVGFDYYYGIPASMNYGYLAWIEGRFTAVNPTLWTKKKVNLLPGVFNDYRIMPPYDTLEGTNNIEVASDFEDVLCLTRFTDKAIEWMGSKVEDARNGRPFFIYIPYTSSHKPVIPRSEFLGLSAAGAYGDFVLETDYHIGNIMKFLDESGLANNTLIVLTSDNGPENTYDDRVAAYGHDSAGIYRGGKRDIYEGGHRVPFIVRWPAGIKAAGRVWDKPVCQTDLLATFAQMLGVTLDDHSGEDSVSFYDVLRDETANPTRLPLINHSSKGRFAIRDGDWKLIMPHSGSSYELYNIASDPTETNDVYTTNPVVVSNLTAKITEIVTSGRSSIGNSVTNDTAWWDDLEWIAPEDY